MSMNAAVFLAYLAERLFIRYLIDFKKTISVESNLMSNSFIHMVLQYFLNFVHGHCLNIYISCMIDYVKEKNKWEERIMARGGGGHCLNQSQYNTIIAGSN